MSCEKKTLDDIYKTMDKYKTRIAYVGAALTLFNINLSIMSLFSECGFA